MVRPGVPIYLRKNPHGNHHLGNPGISHSGFLFHCYSHPFKARRKSVIAGWPGPNRTNQAMASSTRR